MPRRKKTEPQSAPRALWPGPLKQPLCPRRHGHLLSGSNRRAKRTPHMPRFAHRAALCFLRPTRQRLRLCGLCREEARRAGLQARCRKKASPPEDSFCAQPLWLPSTAAEGSGGKLPCPASKAAAFGAPGGFDRAALEERRAKKSGRPSGPPGFLRAAGAKSASPNRCFLASTRLSRGLFIFLLCPQTRPVRGP